jgi:hypothetical protein
MGGPLAWDVRQGLTTRHRKDATCYEILYGVCGRLLECRGKGVCLHTRNESSGGRGVTPPLIRNFSTR